MYDVPEGAAYAVLYTVLSVFTCVAILTTVHFSPSSIFTKLGCVMRSIAANDEAVSKELASADYFLAARNAAGARLIALSFFASGMGAWVVYGSTEMGANPSLSWLGVIGYSVASSLPAIIICIIGPRVRAITGEKAFCTTDFGLVRYGRLMQLAIAGMSIFYMFIFLVSEMTSISNVYGLIVGLDTFSDDTLKYTTSIAISLAVFTWFYTSFGLPASIVTDKFQAYLMFSLVFILLIVACSNPENRVTKAEFSVASNWTLDGLAAAVTLIIAVSCAEMFNQGNWQRVWAAKSVKDLRQGFMAGSFLVFLLMMFFGIMGMLGYANDPESYDNFEKFAYLAFFDILAPLSTFWHIIVLILVTALAASTVDTLQTAIASIFSSDLLRFGVSDNVARFSTRLLLLLVNIPAIILSSKRFNVIGLFLVADLVCGTAVLPVFLGLITEDVGFIPAPTELGAFLGILSGMAAVVVNGKVIGFDQAVNPITGEVIATGPFSYFWLTNSSQCAVCGTKTMITFIVVPLVAGFFTLLFSKLDVVLRGERARKPIFTIAQPLEAKNYDLAKKESKDQVAVTSKDIYADDYEENNAQALGLNDDMIEEIDSNELNFDQSVESAA